MSTCSCSECVTIFSSGGKFRLVSNFTELHATTLATCSYALLMFRGKIKNDVYINRSLFCLETSRCLRLDVLSIISLPLPQVYSRVFRWSHHGVCLASPRLSIRYDTHVIAVHPGSDDGLSVIKHLYTLDCNVIEC